jgi:hypothetical protein
MQSETASRANLYFETGRDGKGEARGNELDFTRLQADRLFQGCPDIQTG